MRDDINFKGADTESDFWLISGVARASFFKRDCWKLYPSELQRDWNDTRKPNFVAFVEPDMQRVVSLASPNHMAGLMEVSFQSL